MELRSWKPRTSSWLFVVEVDSSRTIIGHFSVDRIIRIDSARVFRFYRNMHLIEDLSIVQLKLPVYGWVLRDQVLLAEPVQLLERPGRCRMFTFTWPLGAPPISRGSSSSSTRDHRRSPPMESPPAEQEAQEAPRKRRRITGKTPDAFAPPAPEPPSAPVGMSKEGPRSDGNRSTSLSIAAKFAILQEYQALAADPHITNAHAEMLKRNRRGYFRGPPHGD
jgi:hypothetical protein